MGINKRSHHSSILKALNIPSVEEVIKCNTFTLFRNVFSSDTPARDFQALMLAEYMLSGRLTKGTLLERVVCAGRDPLKIILLDQKISAWSSYAKSQGDGVADSLRYLLCHEEYNKPWSDAHIMATLLTKAF